MDNRKEIIAELKKFFKIEELICPEVATRDHEMAWRYLQTPFLADLLVIRRDILKVGMTCNTYHIGGDRKDCGLRSNLCEQIARKNAENRLYISAHYLGCAGDFVFSAKSGMTAEKARNLINDHQDLLPYPLRMEKDKTWLHFDTYENERDPRKVVLFVG